MAAKTASLAACPNCGRQYISVEKIKNMTWCLECERQ